MISAFTRKEALNHNLIPHRDCSTGEDRYFLINKQRNIKTPILNYYEGLSIIYELKMNIIQEYKEKDAS